MSVELTTPLRPLPAADDASAPYWEAARRHELRVQRCARCGVVRFPPQPMCDRCQSFDVAWVAASGRATVVSFVVAHPPVLPAFQERVPLPIVLVELDDHPGVRLVGNLVEAPVERLAIGLAVEVVFERISDAIALPQWRARG